MIDYDALPTDAPVQTDETYEVGDKVFSTDAGFCYVIEHMTDDGTVMVQEACRPEETELSETLVDETTIRPCADDEFPNYGEEAPEVVLEATIGTEDEE